MKTISQLKDETMLFIAGKKKPELEKLFTGIKDDRFIYGVLECHLLGAMPLVDPELVQSLKKNSAFTESAYRMADRALESANITVKPIRESIYEREVKKK